MLREAAGALERYNYYLFICRNTTRRHAARVSAIVDALHSESMSPGALKSALDSLSNENRLSEQPDNIDEYIRAVYAIIQRRMLNPSSTIEPSILFYALDFDHPHFPSYLEALSFLDLPQKLSILKPVNKKGVSILAYLARYAPDAFVFLMSIVTTLPMAHQTELLNPARFINGEWKWQFMQLEKNNRAANAFFSGLESLTEEARLGFLTFQWNGISLLTLVLAANLPKLAFLVIALIDKMKVEEKETLFSNFKDVFSLSIHHCPQVLEPLLGLLSSCYLDPRKSMTALSNAPLTHAVKCCVETSDLKLLNLVMGHIENTYDDNAIMGFLLSSGTRSAAESSHAQITNHEGNILEMTTSDSTAFLRLLDTVSRLPTSKRYEVLCNSPGVFDLIYSSNNHLDYSHIDKSYVLPLMRMILTLDESQIAELFKDEPGEPNPLFFNIVCKFPRALSYLLTALSQPTYNDMHIKLLLTVDDDERNLLMRVADCSKQGLEHLIAEIQKLDNRHLVRTLLSQQTRRGETLLSYAVNHRCWTTLPILIDFISTAKEPEPDQTTIYELKVQLLKPIDLIISLGTDDTYINLKVWLQALEQLNYADQLAIFQQTISKNRHLLSVACHKGLVALTSLLLDFVMKFNEADRNAILLQRDDIGMTLLSSALDQGSYELLDLLLNKLQSYPAILLGLTDQTDLVAPATELQQAHANRIRLLAFIDRYHSSELGMHITEILNSKQEMVMVPVFKDSYQQLRQFLQKACMESTAPMEESGNLLTSSPQLATLIELSMSNISARKRPRSTISPASMSNRFFSSSLSEKTLEHLSVKIQQLIQINPQLPTQIVEDRSGRISARITLVESEVRAVVGRLMEQDELEYEINHCQGITHIRLLNLERDASTPSSSVSL